MIEGVEVSWARNDWSEEVIKGCVGRVQSCKKMNVLIFQPNNLCTKVAILWLLCQ